jgi:hypothetical protein
MVPDYRGHTTGTEARYPHPAAVLDMIQYPLRILYDTTNLRVATYT